MKLINLFKKFSALYLPSSKIHVDCVKGLVSVVLPVFNGEKYITEAIESVIMQSYKNWELIIIDDGSCDGSLNIALAYAKSDKRIKVFHQENQKLPRALNNGFSRAKGEYYTWISADNRMLCGCLSIMVSELKAHQTADMVYGNMYLIDKAGERLTHHGWFELPPGSGNVILPRSAHLLNTVANNTIGAAFMYRASADVILGGYSPDMFLLEDYDYFMRMNSLFHIKHIKTNKPVYAYRFHDGSLTSKDEELGITASRPQLMELDKKRRRLYNRPLYFSANRPLPFGNHIFKRFGLYKSDNGDFCLDDYNINTGRGGYSVYYRQSLLCRLKSAADTVRFIRLHAVCNIAKGL